MSAYLTVCDVCSGPTYTTTCAFCAARIAAIESDPTAPTYLGGAA